MKMGIVKCHAKGGPRDIYIVLAITTMKKILFYTINSRDLGAMCKTQRKWLHALLWVLSAITSHALVIIRWFEGNTEENHMNNWENLENELTVNLMFHFLEIHCISIHEGLSGF